MGRLVPALIASAFLSVASFSANAASIVVDGTYPTRTQAFDVCNAQSTDTTRDCSEVVLNTGGLSSASYTDNSSGFVYHRFLFCKAGGTIGNAESGFGYEGFTCIEGEKTYDPPEPGVTRDFELPNSLADAVLTGSENVCYHGYEWSAAEEVQLAIRIAGDPTTMIGLSPSGEECTAYGGDGDGGATTEYEPGNIWKGDSASSGSGDSLVVVTTEESGSCYSINGDQRCVNQQPECSTTLNGTTVCSSSAANRPTAGDGSAINPDITVSDGTDAGTDSVYRADTIENAGPGSGSGDGSGSDSEGDGESFESPGGLSDSDYAPDFGASGQRLSDALTGPGTPVSAFQSLTQSIPSGGTCPTATFTVLEHQFTIDAQCTLLNSIAPVLHALMLGIYAVIGLLIILKV